MCAFVCCFPFRSDSVARTYKGAIPIQHPVKDPAAACRDQGCKAAVKRDEEREGVPHHLWLRPRNGCWDPEAGVYSYVCVHIFRCSTVMWVLNWETQQETVVAVWVEGSFFMFSSQEHFTVMLETVAYSTCMLTRSCDTFCTNNSWNCLCNYVEFVSVLYWISCCRNSIANGVDNPEF